MRIFVIRDEKLGTKELGYLVYYEQSKSFYIELPNSADEMETPNILSSFVSRGEYSVNAYWSMQWVRQRIHPQVRYSFEYIMKEKSLDEYDELSLLLLANGRCAQDSVYVEENNQLPKEIQERWRYKVEDVIPLADNNELLVFFRDGTARRLSVTNLTKDNQIFIPYLTNKDLFCSVMLQPDGYGILWSENAVLSDHLLYCSGEKIPLQLEDIYHFVSKRIVNASQAQQLLNCTRQNIYDLVKRGKLHPIRTDEKNRLFRLVEIQQRLKCE